MKKLILLPALAMFACIDEGKETGGEETGTEEVADPTASISVDWGADSVTLTLAVENGLEGASYFWGIAETSGSCLDSEWGCWTGEDCFRGFDTESGNLTYCHPVDATGGNLSYGATPDGVAEGMDTVFGSADFSSVTTHIVDDQGSAEGPCWVWGADATYYSGYGKTCTEM